MATLGGMLPPDQARRLLETRLSPGSVVFLNVIFPRTGVSKPKFAVLVGSDGDDLFFVINTRPSAFIERNQHLAACQVKIDKDSHSFLEHDSYVGCEEVVRISRRDVLRDLVAESWRLKGVISDEVRVQVVAAVKRAPTLSKLQVDIILRGLGT